MRMVLTLKMQIDDADEAQAVVGKLLEMVTPEPDPDDADLTHPEGVTGRIGFLGDTSNLPLESDDDDEGDDDDA